MAACVRVSRVGWHDAEACFGQFVCVNAKPCPREMPTRRISETTAARNGRIWNIQADRVLVERFCSGHCAGCPHLAAVPPSNIAPSHVRRFRSTSPLRSLQRQQRAHPHLACATGASTLSSRGNTGSCLRPSLNSHALWSDNRTRAHAARRLGEGGALSSPRRSSNRHQAFAHPPCSRCCAIMKAHRSGTGQRSCSPSTDSTNVCRARL